MCFVFTTYPCPDQVHGDYSEDLGVKVERPAEDVPAEETEVVGA